MTDTEDYAPETIAIAREWITDCLIEYTNDEDASCAHWSNERVMRYIEREYDGGLAGFLRHARWILAACQLWSQA